MKAIVVKQPWATLVAIGSKTIETRPWPPNGPMRPDGVRGLPGLPIQRGERIAIVAGKAWPDPKWSVGPWMVGGWTTTGIHVNDEDGECPCPDPEDGVWSDECKALNAWNLSLLHDDGAHGVSHAAPLPLGAVVCTVTVDDALPIVAPMTDPPNDHLVVTTDGHLVWWKFTPVLSQRRWSAASRHPMLNERTVVDGRRDPDLDPQLPLGDFTPDRWGWMLSDPRPREPIPCKGRQGVFELPADMARKVMGVEG